jgi:F0F1-type ATP synthase membrane subunit b/b'
LSEIDQLQRQMDASLQDARRAAKEAFEQASAQIKDDRQKQLASVDRMIQKNLKEAQTRIHEHKAEILAEMNLMIEQLADAYPVADAPAQKTTRRRSGKTSATADADFDA